MNMRAEDAFEVPITHRYDIDTISLALERFFQVSTRLWGKQYTFDVHAGKLHDLEIEWRLGDKRLFLNVGKMFGETLRVDGPGLNRSMKKRRSPESDEARELMDWFVA